MHLKLAPQGSDWQRCPTCGHSMTAIYNKILKCLRCVQPTKAGLTRLSTRDVKRANHFKIAEAE